MFGKKNNELNEESVRAALSTVQEPELHNNLIALNMIRDLTIHDGTVSFTIMLTTPACLTTLDFCVLSRPSITSMGAGRVRYAWSSMSKSTSYTFPPRKHCRSSAMRRSAA